MATAVTDETKLVTKETDEPDAPQERFKKPVCLIVLGMAGSGKTTFVQQLVSRLHVRKQPPYVINLDPACREVYEILYTTTLQLCMTYQCFINVFVISIGHVLHFYIYYETTL